jgi:DnaJ family protein A protein 1
MPQYRNPFEKGRLIISFNVVFPDRLEPVMANALAAVLPADTEPMIPDDHEEVDLNDFDPNADRAQQQSRHAYDEDEEGHGHGPGGVSCATQ